MQRRLKLISSQESVPDRIGNESLKRWQGDDPVFFHRRQVQLGTRLLCTGRIDYGTTWEVVEIKHYRPGFAYAQKLTAPIHLGDTLVIRRLGGNELRSATFHQFSYSAIWRLA